MEPITNITYVLFSATVILSLWLFYSASNYSKKVLIISISWIILQSILGYVGFYQNYDAIPPRLIFMIGPPILFIVYMLLYKKNILLEQFDLRKLSLLSVVRIPVEICLLQLFLSGYIPKLMTFEGLNFDIFSGLSAIAVYYFAFRNNKINKSMLLIWNFICLALVLNIVCIGILSAKTPFQQLSFEQANIGVTLFPFNLLPAFIVPVVIFSHIVSFLQLRKMSKFNQN